MRLGRRGFDRLGGAFGRRRVVLANMFGQGPSGAVKAAGLDRGPDIRQAGPGRVIGDRRGARNRVHRYAADTVDAAQLSLYPARSKDGKQIADVECAGGHGCFLTGDGTSEGHPARLSSPSLTATTRISLQTCSDSGDSDVQTRFPANRSLSIPMAKSVAAIDRRPDVSRPSRALMASMVSGTTIA